MENIKLIQVSSWQNIIYVPINLAAKFNFNRLKELYNTKKMEKKVIDLRECKEDVEILLPKKLGNYSTPSR